MTRVSYDFSQLEKHGVTTDDIDQVFESDLTIAQDLTPSERGNDRAMVIGWTLTGRLLEIGIEYFQHEDREHVFHAKDAGEQYRKDFERRL